MNVFVLNQSLTKKNTSLVKIMNTMILFHKEESYEKGQLTFWVFLI